jgi:hypothetical protein
MGDISPAEYKARIVELEQEIEDLHSDEAMLDRGKAFDFTGHRCDAYAMAVTLIEDAKVRLLNSDGLDRVDINDVLRLAMFLVGEGEHQ